MRASSASTPPVLAIRRNIVGKPVVVSSFSPTVKAVHNDNLIHKQKQQVRVLNPSSKKSIHWRGNAEDQLQDERHVDFNENNIQYYGDPCERNPSLEWYSDDDLAEMKQQAIIKARLAVSSNSHHMTWPRALGYAYNAFVNARAVQDLNDTMSMVTKHVHLLVDEDSIEVLGLEKWTVGAFRRDRTRRRHALAREIHYWASRHHNSKGNDYYFTPDNDESDDDVSMGDVCREISRSSRMFAFHTGRMLAMQVEA
eukprot:scaffold18208_cov182-Amphora_coffeaeformis.AAC.4